VEVVQGGVDVSKTYWHNAGIYTGSVAVGKIVAQAAAEHLTCHIRTWKKSLYY
jgi:aldehyde dehydrogenase (NAD+)